jgi:hypothetical protein
MALVRTCRPTARRGATATELVLLLLLLPFTVVFAVELAQLYFFSAVTVNSARQPAMYESNSFSKVESPDKSLQEAVPADAPNADNPGEKLPVAPTTEANPNK